MHMSTWLSDYGVRLFGILATGGVAAITAVGGAGIGEPAAARENTRMAIYVGTYANGIYRLEFDASTGAATVPVVAALTPNPSFLALHPNGRVLYAVNEVADFGGSRTGAVSAFSVGASDGRLTLLNQQPSAGADPCHLIVDGAGRHLIVANYSTGTVAVLPIDAIGRLSQPVSVRQHHGHGPDSKRQEAPHAHAVTFDQSGRFLFEADLGTDRIHTFRFDAEAGRLVPTDPPDVVCEPGSGPRHFAWHPSGRMLYVLNELESTVTALAFDAANGRLTSVQTQPMLPAGFAGLNTGAELAVLPNGRFLFASNRGHDSLARFAIDPATGALTPAGHVPAGGKTPRHFAVDPSSRWLLAANQDSDAITIFRLDAASGALTPVGQIAVPKPVCVLFTPR